MGERANPHPAVFVLHILAYVPAAWLVMMLAGFVGVNLWGWFIVDLGVPPIGLWHACGLLTLGGLLKLGLKLEEFEDGDMTKLQRAWARLIWISLSVLVLWWFGSVYHTLQGLAS